MARFDGANFLRGYLRFIRGYFLVLGWALIIAIFSLILIDHFRPDLRLFVRKRQPEHRLC
jgi:hypothetical protein